MRPSASGYREPTRSSSLAMPNESTGNYRTHVATSKLFLNPQPMPLTSSGSTSNLIPLPRPATHHASLRPRGAPSSSLTTSASAPQEIRKLVTTSRPFTSLTYGKPPADYSMASSTQKPSPVTLAIGQQQNRAATSPGGSRLAPKVYNPKFCSPANLIESFGECEALPSQAEQQLDTEGGFEAATKSSIHGRHYSHLLQADRDKHRTELDALWQRLERAEGDAKRAVDELKRFQSIAAALDRMVSFECEARVQIMFSQQEAILDLMKAHNHNFQSRSYVSQNKGAFYPSSNIPDISNMTITVRDSDLIRTLKATQHRLQEAEDLLSTIPIPSSSSSLAPSTDRQPTKNDQQKEWYLKLSALATTHYQVVPDHVIEALRQRQIVTAPTHASPLEADLCAPSDSLTRKRPLRASTSKRRSPTDGDGLRPQTSQGGVLPKGRAKHLSF